MIDFDETLRESMASRLAAHRLHTIELDGHKRAAVAVVIVDGATTDDTVDPYQVSDDEMIDVPGDVTGLDGRMQNVAGGASFLLCRRASRMNSHAAQWALPGGRIDPGETPEETALRELHEELGVRLGPEVVLGRLDDYATRSGYVITPVVVWGGGDLELHPNPDEVAYVYRIGVHHLLRDDSPRYVNIPESDRPVVQIPLGGDLIHAPTGAVLLQFRWVAIDGRSADDARVHHLEQPVFAWR